MDKIRAQGLGVAAISYDSVAVLKSFAERRGITFTLLSDPDSKIIRDFGILNEQVQAGSTQYGIPNPGTYLVDRNGRVTAKYFEDDITQRYTSGDILVNRFGERAGAAQTSAEGKHLKVSASASNARVRSGQRISLVLEVALPARMHVYAPGVSSDYIPIDPRFMRMDPDGRIHERIFFGELNPGIELRRPIAVTDRDHGNDSGVARARNHLLAICRELFAVEMSVRIDEHGKSPSVVGCRSSAV